MASAPQLPAGSQRPDASGRPEGALADRGPEARLLAVLDGPAQAAAAGWLVGYSAATRAVYARNLHRFAVWCHARGLELLAVHRAHVDLYARHLDETLGRAQSTVARALSAIASYYRWPSTSS